MRRNNLLQNLHPVTLLCLCVCILAVTVFVPHPVLTLLSLCGATLLCFAEHGFAATAKQYLFYIPTVALIAVINPIFAHDGATPLLFIADLPYTLEAMISGCEIGITIAATLAWCKAFEPLMTSDKLVFLFGRILPKSSLVIASVLRYIPKLKRTLASTKQAQIMLGCYKGDGDLRSASTVYSSLIARSLENSIVTSDSMACRGYGLKDRSVYAIYHFKSSDGMTVLCTIALFVLTLCMSGEYSFYPDFVIGCNIYGAVSFALLALMPCIVILKEALVWRLYLSRI